MRTIKKILRKILFGRAFGGLEWPQVAALRDRLVKRSQATPEADDDLPGIEYLGWTLATRSLNRAFATTALCTMAAAFAAVNWHQPYPGRDISWIAVGIIAAVVAAVLYATRRTFLAEARQSAPQSPEARNQAGESLSKAERAVRRLRREMPECFWALVTRVDAKSIVLKQIAACDDVARATVALSSARGHIDDWGEPAVGVLEKLVSDCGKLWPGLTGTLRLFDPGPLEAAGENVIIETAPPSPPDEPLAVPQTDPPPSA
jgi:hypothetical protein